MSAMAGSHFPHLPQLALGAVLLLFCIAPAAAAQAPLAESTAVESTCSATSSCASQSIPTASFQSVGLALAEASAQPNAWRSAPLGGIASFQPVTSLASSEAAPRTGGGMLPASWLVDGVASPMPVLLPLAVLGVLAIAAALGVAGWRRRRQDNALPPLALPAEGLVAAIGRSVDGLADRQEQTLETRRAEIAGAAAELRELAAQTRLMALNARTVAASAGPDGLPMARAAERVDRLARQVASTAEEIGQSIAMLESEGGEPPAVKSASARGAEGWPAGIALARVHEAAMATREQGGGSEAAARKLESVARIIEQVTASLRQTAAVLNEATGQARH